MTKVTKNGQIIDLMNKNASLPMAKVVELIATKVDVSPARARAYYGNFVRKGLAKGAVDKTRATIAVMRGVLETMAVKPERMAKAAAEGYGTATELADVIVRERIVNQRVAPVPMEPAGKADPGPGALLVSMSENDIGRRKRGSIIHTIARHGDDMAVRAQSLDHSAFLLG